MTNTTSYVRVVGNEVDDATDDTTYIFNPTDALKTFTLAGKSDGDTVAISALSTDFKAKVSKNLLTLTGLKTGASAGTIIKIQLDTSNGGVDHLAFLDGKVDVTFTPNEPGSLKGSWTIGGVNVSKKYNFANHAGDYAIDSSYTYAQAAYDASGVLDADRYVLTTDTDDVEIQFDNTYDLVRGIIDYSGEDGETSTFSTFDTIVGNGHTAVEIGVHNTSGAHDADLVSMSGVDQLKILDGTDNAATLTMDASTYGGDISNIILEGNDSFRLCINDLEVNGALDSDNSDDCSALIVDGTVDGINFFECIANDTGTSEAIVGVGANGIMTTISEASSIYVSVTQENCVTSDDASVGNLTVGDISVDGDVSAYNCLDIDNIAAACCTGDAVAGDLNIGDIDVSMGVSGSNTMYFTNCAYAYCGDATVGDLHIGNVTVEIGNSGCNGLYVYNSASDGYTGNAVAGNLTIGDIDLHLGSCVTSYLTAYNCAYAYSKDSTVGDLTVGNIHVEAADHTCQWICLENEAWNCVCEDEVSIMGNIAVGDIEIDLGTDNTVCLSIYNYGSAYYGTSCAGDVVIGDVTVDAVSSNLAVLCAGNYLCWSSNESTTGNVTVGDVNVDMNGVYNSFCMVVENCQYGYDGTVGDTTIGDIHAYMGADAYVYVAANVYNYSHEAGNVTIGNVDITIENAGTSDCGTAYLDLDLTASSFGDVTIGDVTMVGGSEAYVAATVDLSATCGDIGNLSIGDVSMDAVVSGTAYYCVCVCGDNDIASIHFGDINMGAEGESAYAWAGVCVSADYGCIGDVTIGDLTANATDYCSYAGLCVYISADDEIGNVSVGDINVQGIGECACASLSLEVYNCYGDIGTITYGNISLTADGKDSYAYANITAEGSCYRDIGAVTVGDINISVSGEDASACLDMSVTSAETIGTTTVGNISISLDIDVSASCALTGNDYAYAYYCMCSCSDDVYIGDISISAAEVTACYDADSDMCADVDLCAYSGSLHIGNVTVTGGYENAGGVADNFGVMSDWLQICFDDEASIGNIDYSGYHNVANIDVSDMDGASIIKAAQDDTNIWLNDTQNTVYLGDGSDTVYVDANATTPTAATAIDVIYNFTVGDDVIETNGTNLATGGTATGYTQFLSSAANAFVTGDYDVYSAKFGGNTYIAVNDGSDAVGYVVKLVGVTTTLSDADVGI